MRQYKILTIPFLLICLVSPMALVSQSRSLVSEMSDLAWAEEVDRARAILEARRVDSEQPTAEWLAAVSWLARGASFAERWDLAERYASEAYEGSLELMKERPLDAERFLPTALGAGIEVPTAPFPALEVDDYLGVQPPTPDELKDKVVLFLGPGLRCWATRTTPKETAARFSLTPRALVRCPSPFPLA